MFHLGTKTVKNTKYEWKNDTEIKFKYRKIDRQPVEENFLMKMVDRKRKFTQRECCGEGKVGERARSEPGAGKQGVRQLCRRSKH